MRAKKILSICLLLGIFFIVYPGNVSASSTVEESRTGVGIHILEGDYPPSPEPPSPIINKNTIVPARKLPKTGSVVSCRWVMIGSILLILIVCITYSLWLRDKKRGMVNET
ncbi:hypothetical protein IBQ15_002648 [Enterococcus faecalis]|nr:hypothetical protein [Enterococcus faecalis]